MRKNTLSTTLAGGLLAMFFVMAGCEEKGPAEKAGEQIDETVEEAGDAIEEAADEAEDATD